MGRQINWVGLPLLLYEVSKTSDTIMLEQIFAWLNKDAKLPQLNGEMNVNTER